MVLARVLVTCGADNTGSARIIEKDGGVLTSETYSAQTKTRLALLDRVVTAIRSLAA
jgi:predicted acetyltransferase